jgi:putative ABC transport system permease protein
MPTVRALVVGRAPRAGGGQAAQRLASRLPLPRAMSLGLAQPFARPARAVLVGAAVLFGVVSVTFAVGLETGFNKYLDASTSGFNVASQIVIPTADVGVPWGLYGPDDPRTPHLDAAKVAAALAGTPGTKTAFGWGESGATIIGAPPGGEPARVFTLTGDFSWTGMELLSGRWYSAPGEAVVGDKLATAVGIHVGDEVTVVQQNKQLPLKVVGINFDTNVGDYTVMTDAATFTAAALTPHIDQFNVELAPNVNGTDWSASAGAALTPLNASVQPNDGGGKNIIVITMGALVATLTLMMMAVAALGVLSTVVQDTRERAHDLGILKALGMTPRQTIVMVLTSVSLTGLTAGLIGVPLGVAVEKATLTPMGNAIGRHLPPCVSHVYTAGMLVPLLAGGIVIALLGALLPAGWAARTRTAAALRTE